MAEIDVQKKEGPSPWVWIVGILALILVVGLIWALTQNGGTDNDRGAMPADTVRDTMPATWDTVPQGGDTWDTLPPAGDPGAARDAATEEGMGLAFHPQRIVIGT